jgi:hypothetical protein
MPSFSWKPAGGSAVVGGAGGLLVRERRLEGVRRQACPLEHLAFVVRAVGHLHRGRYSLDRVLAQARARKVTIADQIHGMAGCADVPVHEKPALQRRLVIGAEDAVERPFLMRQRDPFGRIGAARREENGDDAG